MFCHRYIEDDILNSLALNKVVILIGARQTGKSTLLNKLLPANTLKINLQDYTKRLDFAKNPLLLRQILEARTEKKTTVFIDEIQKIPELLAEIQYLYDNNPEKYQFFLTGSSARKLIRHSYNLLPGRSHLYQLSPVSQIERGGKSLFLNKNFDKTPKFPAVNLEELLLFGSLPGIFNEPQNSKIKTLNTYTELYLEEEIRQEFAIKDIGLFSNFLELAAQEAGAPISLSNLSQEIGLSVPTIKNYYQILVDTYTGYWILPYTKNTRKRLLATPKFFFFDNGIKNAAAKTGFSLELLNAIGGKLFEHWVGVELYHQLKLLGPEYTLYYYRTISGVEIDFIVESPQEIIPIEVKWTKNPTPGDARHIENFILEQPKAKKGYIICRCAEPRQISTNVTALPWNGF